MRGSMMRLRGLAVLKMISSIESFSMIFHCSGRLDARDREKATRLVMDTLEPIVPEEKPGKVIDVKHRFAKKKFDDRYLWKPTPEIETAIQRAIFG